MRTIFHQFVVGIAMSLSIAVAHGQVATGQYPYGTFDNKGFDTINVGNLNVHFSIPVLNKAGRGLPFYYNLSYDNSIWYPVSVNGVSAWTPVQSFGWRGDTEIVSGYISYTQANISASCIADDHLFHYIKTSTISSVVYHDTFGVSHPFQGEEKTTNPCPVGSGSDDTTTTDTISSSTVDGSGYQLAFYAIGPNPNGPIIDKTGRSFAVPVNVNSGQSFVQDTNGNEISMDGSGNFTDTTGSVALAVAGTAPSPHTFTYKDTSGNPQTVTMTYKPYTVQTNFGCNGIGEYGPASESLVDTITFPDNSTYHFTYESTLGYSSNVTGRIASVELRQGGTIQYAYSGSNNGIECSDGSTAGLTRILSNAADSPESTSTYIRTSPNGANTSHTEVVDGLSNHIAYDFVEASDQPTGTTAAYYETHRAVYQGAESGTPVIARNMCYNAATSPCTATLPTVPFSQIDTYETLDGVQTHGASAKFDSYGDETEADVYDFGGASSRGALLSKQTAAFGYSVAGLPTEVDQYDGSSHQIGETRYRYDETTPTATSGIPQHNSVSGPRGNLTTQTVYANSSTYYAVQNTYEDTGDVLTTTSPTGISTYTYDSSTHVYNMGTSLPTPSSGIPLSTSASFDTSYTGLPLISKDFNTQPTTITSYDSMLRPTEVQFPDGGKTAWSYTPTSKTTNIYQSLSVYGTSESIYDEYGRLSRAITTNGQSTTPWYQQDYCYDGNGNVNFVSYPYQGTGESEAQVCSGAGDTYSYDVLGRVKQISRENGETLTYTYTGRATKSIDENSAVRISQVDGLGRPTIVCEISSNSTMPGSGSPVNCGTDITGTGFTTIYAYNQTTTTVTQGAQPRTFQIDWLGRTTSITEPESGTTTYSYAYNSTGLAVTRTKPKANQSSASTTATTTTQYDSVGRPVSITYSDGTPTKTYSYDASAGWSDLAQVNLKGRLSKAAVSNAQTTYSYDEMGRVSDLGECLPSKCGTATYDKLLHYHYDLAGNLSSSTDGAGVTSTYTVTLANELLTLTSSLSNSANPAAILSDVNSGPNGPASYSLGNGLKGVYSYDSLGRLSGGWICNGSTSANCAGGTTAYGFAANWKGVRLTGSSDTVLNQTSTYGYDEFNRLTSRTVTAGTAQNFSYVYDRYGNRWQQNVTAGSGPAPQLSFNTATNQVSTNGYTYDAAGNMTNDGSHTYTYDADGNVISVDSGSMATYIYDALNHRVQSVTSSGTTQFVFNANGQRVSIWNGSTNAQIQGQYYWGSKPVAYYKSGAVHFQHQDWLGTERERTSYNGVVEGTYNSLPFGDAQTASGSDTDAYHYAILDYDSETETSHAQYRQDSTTQGRWMMPDPYSGSYDFSNPQSFNRYAYVMNNPTVFTDPTGLLLQIGSCFYTLESTQMGLGPIYYTLDTEYCLGDTGDGRAFPGGGGGGGGGSPRGGGGGTGTSAPSKGPRSGYESLFCLGDAIKSNALSVALDAVGLIPEAEGFTKVFENTAGYQLARAVGNNAGYRGVVATQYGMMAVAQGKGGVAMINGALGLGDTSVEGRISTGATVAGFIPGLGTGAAAVSLGVDAYKIVKAQSACVDSGKYD